MDLTVLELQFPNAEFNAPYANTSKEPTDDTTTQTAHEPSGSGIFPLVFLLIVAGIAVVAYILRTRNPTSE